MSKCLFLPPLLHPLETLTSYQAPTDTEPLLSPRAAQLHHAAVPEEGEKQFCSPEGWMEGSQSQTATIPHSSLLLLLDDTTYSQCCSCRKSLCVWLKRGSRHLVCLYSTISASGFNTAGEQQPQHNRSHLELRLALGPHLYIILTVWVLLGLSTAAGGSVPPLLSTLPHCSSHLRPPVFPWAASNAVLLAYDLMCGRPQRTPGK